MPGQEDSIALSFFKKDWTSFDVAWKIFASEMDSVGFQKRDTEALNLQIKQPFIKA